LADEIDDLRNGKDEDALAYLMRVRPFPPTTLDR
jgi:hypothetical protein